MSTTHIFKTIIINGNKINRSAICYFRISQSIAIKTSIPTYFYRNPLSPPEPSGSIEVTGRFVHCLLISCQRKYLSTARNVITLVMQPLVNEKVDGQKFILLFTLTLYRHLAACLSECVVRGS